jgi:sortase family protein
MRVSHTCRRLPRRWWAPPLAVGTGLVAAAAWGVGAHQPRLPEAGPPPALSRQTVRVATGQDGARLPTVLPTAPSAAPPAVLPAVLPVGAESVQIPSLHVAAGATPETVHAGQLGVPADPARVGWWMPSISELVIDGHVDTAATGPGALYRTGSLRAGAAVTVRTAVSTEHWTIDGVRAYRKGHVPAGLFSGYGPRLVIITCGGPFDHATRHYYDNVVAYASPARG